MQTLKEVYESFNKEGFEKWAISRELEVEPYSFNPKFIGEIDYEDIQTDFFWDCWKASFVGFCKLVVDGKISKLDTRPKGGQNGTMGERLQDS